MDMPRRPDPAEEKKIKKYIPLLQQAVVKNFNAADWKKFGYDINASEAINDHPRLLRSLQWNDDDYEVHVFDALEGLLEGRLDRFQTLLKTTKIKDWIAKERPEKYSDLYDEESFVETFKPQKLSPKEVVFNALDDAQVQINLGKPENAIDRVHTGVHGYFKAVCEEYKLAHADDASITAFFKLIYQNIPAISSNSKEPEQIKKLLMPWAATIDSLNYLRNNSSMAHVNDLLTADEATLAINAARTLLHYIEAKIH